MNQILDKKDRAVLFELDRNCRQTLKTLAMRLQMPIETARYRIERLERAGIIKNYLAVVDGGRLGFYYFKVLLRLHNVNESAVRTLIAELAAEPTICWVVRVDGPFDIAFTPRVTNPLEQSALMDKIRAKYAKLIQSWALSINLQMRFFGRDYLIGNIRRNAALGSYSASNAAYRPDFLEEKILHELAKDPRSAGSQIASTLEVAPETVLSRIRRLERELVLVRYMTVLNNQSLKQLNYYVLLYLSATKPARQRAFELFCAAQPNIIYMIKALGAWDYELNIEVSSPEDYRALMMLMSKQFSDMIREYIGLSVYEICKYVYP